MRRARIAALMALSFHLVPSAFAQTTPPTLLFVLKNSSPFSVLVIDPATNVVTKTIPVAGASLITSSPDGRYVFVGKTTNPQSVSIIDAVTQNVVSVLPVRDLVTSGMAVSPDSKYLYTGGSWLTVYDIQKAITNPSTAKVMDQQIPFADIVGAFGFSPDGKTLYAVVSETSGLKIYEYDGLTFPTLGNSSLRRKITATLPRSPQLNVMTFLADGTRAYIGALYTGTESKFMIIDVAAGTVLGTPTLPVGIAQMRSRPDGTSVLGRTLIGVAELNPQNLAVIRQLNVSTLPPQFGDTRGFEEANDNDTVYVIRTTNLDKVQLVAGTASPGILTLPSTAWGITISGTRYRFVILPKVAISVQAVHASSITYTWTAVSSSTAYDFRYATFPITSEAFYNAATQVPIPAPLPPGSTEIFTLAGLSPDATYYAAVKVINSEGLSGQLSNSPGAKTRDIQAPATVTDLAAQAVWQTSVTLTWTAVGDNGNSGRATRYDLRYSSSPIGGLADFLLATAATVPSTPQLPGARETFAITGLSTETTYYFALRVLDEAELASDLSNVASGTTPDITPPGAMSLSVAIATEHSLTYAWIATGDGGSTGTATSYDFRYATYPILTQASFAGATRAFLPAPRVAGAPESFTLSGLSADTTYFAAIKAIDEAGNVGPLSNSPGAHTLDLVPPASVTGLKVAGVSATTMTLTWTAVGDNGLQGRASSYDLRYATFAISTELDFAAAVAVVGVSTPQGPGSLERTSIQGLASDTTYFVAVKAVDEEGQAGGLSNVVSTRTIDILPPAGVSDLAALTGTNKGEILLSWTAVGDNGLLGRASRYVIKASTSPIATQADFNSAQTVAQSLTPAPSGAPESFTVTGLLPDRVYHLAVEAVDKAGNQGALSNAVSTTSQRDFPPAPVTTLAAVAPSSHTVRLTWIATGDDGSIGRVAAYDLRWALSAIDESNFASANSVPGVPAPLTAGSTESFIVAGLPAETNVHFAIKAVDTIGQVSDISNVVQSTTTGEAAIAAFVALPETVVSGQGAAIRVLVADSAGRPVPRIRVTFSVFSGGGSLSPLTAFTGDDGVAETVFTAPATNVVVTLKATVPGFQTLQAELVVVSASLAAIEGFPTTPLVFTGGPTTLSTSSLAYQWLSVDPAGIVDNFLMIGSQGDLALGGWVETNPVVGIQGYPFSLLVALNGFLYNFGGAGSQYTQIQADGSLGAWQSTLSPPDSVMSGFIHQGRIYVFVVGGAVYRPAIDAATGRVTSWTQVASNFLTTNRMGFDAGVFGDSAYVIGGSNPDLNVFESSAVFVARIQSDGSIPSVGQPGHWKPTTPLPAFYSNHRPAPRIVSVGAYLYVIGGKGAQTVFFARPNADGTIPGPGQSGTWTPTTSLPESNDGLTAVSHNNAIYLVGGTDGILPFQARGRSFRAVPNPDGTIPPIGSAGYWKLTTPLPGPAIGRSAVAGNRLYIVDQPSGKVRFAEILPNGNFGSWRRLANVVQTGPLVGASPTQRRSFAWSSVPVPGGNRVFVAGGVPQGANQPVADVFTSFLPSPFVGFTGAAVTQLDWNVAEPLPRALRDSAAVSHNGAVYVLGGKIANGDPTDTIYSAVAASNPLQWSVAGRLPTLSNATNLVAGVANGYVYVTGIGLGRFEVYGAPLGGGGAVGSFARMANLPQTTFGATNTSILGHRGYLYVCVGNQAYSAAPDAAGMVSQWRQEPGIPNGGTGSGPYKVGLVASNQTLYATGGAGDVDPLAVYSAQIGVDGRLGLWKLVGHMPDVRNTGVAILNDDHILTFGPRMDAPPFGQLQSETGTFHADTLAAAVHLSGSDVFAQSVGAATDFFGSSLSLLRGQTYFASVRTRSSAGFLSRPGVSEGTSVAPPASPPDILPPRTTLHVGLPSAGAAPTFISPRTPLTFTTADDRQTIGDNLGDGARLVTAMLDGVIISSDPAAVVTISTEGPHVFTFYASDAIGNTEQPQQLGLIVDGSSPVTQIIAPQAFDVVAGSYTVVQGVAVDTFTFIDRVLVSADGDQTFSTAVITGVIDGVAYWQMSAALPTLTSTVTISAHAVDLIGNYDAVGSSVPVLVFNVINTTVAVAASPRVVPPGSLVVVRAQAATQLGGPLAGAQVAFSATVANSLDPAEAAGGVPLPPVSFAPSVAVTDAFGIATTTLAVGGFDRQFTALMETNAAAQFCIEAAPLVGMTPAQCPGYGNLGAMNITATFMIQRGISNGTLTTQAQVDAVQAQMQTIAQEQFQAASAALFNKSIGVITVTARVLPTSTPPFVAGATVTTNLLSIPYPVDLTGLPTSDSGEQPNSITYGDNNTATPLPMPGQTGTLYGIPQTDTDLISLAQARSAGTGGTVYRTAGFDLGDVIGGISDAVDAVTNFLDPGRIGADKLFAAGDFLNNVAGNYILDSVPGARLAVLASAYGMDFLMGNNDTRNLVADAWGDRAGLTLADLASFGILPPSVTKLIPPGLSVGLDISGALAGKPTLGVNAGFKAGGLDVTYNSGSGLNISQQIDGLQTNFSGAGFSSSFNLGSLIAEQPLGQMAQQYGLKSLSVGLLSGSYTGRLKLDIAKIQPDFDGRQFLKALGSDLDAEQFSMTGFGNLFKNLPSWSAGSAISFRNLGISFSQNSLFGGLNLGRIAFPKLPNLGQGSPQPAPVPVIQDPGKFSDALACAAGAAAQTLNLSGSLYTPANAYQSLSVDNGYFTAANSVSGVTPNPVNTATGNLLYSVQDALVKGRPLFIQMVRIYNSLDFGSGPLGNGWSFNYGMSLSSRTQDGLVTVRWGDGSRRQFLANPDGSYRAPYATQSSLARNPDGTHTLTHKRGTRYHFDSAGRLDLITDKNGNTLTLAYAGGNLSAITDPAGKALVFEHDAAGRITRMTDPSGAVTSYVYNAAGDLVQVTAPGYSASYAYDARHGLVSYQDARSQTGFPKGGFAYNEFRQVVAETDGLGNRVASLSYALEGGGVKATVADAGQKQTVDVYDSTGAWVSRINPLGGVTRFVFDEAGRMTRVTEPDGAVTQLSYDSKGNKTSVVDPAGAQYQYAYDAGNNLVSATLPNGGQVSRTYDAAGNLKTVVDAEGNVSRFAYDAAGLMTAYTDAGGQVTSLGYDAAGNLSVVTRPGGGERRLAHDVLGRLTSTTDENGQTTSFARNASGYLATITYPEGETYSFAYDANGKLARETDQAGQSTLYANDERGLPVEITDAAGGVTRLAHDAAGRLIRRTDRTGGVYTTEYDALARIVKETDPRGGAYRFTYDAAGRRTSIIDPVGSTLSLAYDRRGRPVTITSPEGAVTTLAYDAMGNLLSLTDPNGGVTSYVHDRTGLVTKVTDAKGQETAIRYDAAGRADRVTSPNGAVQSFAYNADGFLTAHTDGGGRTVRYGVDPAGRLTSVTDPLNNVTRYGRRWNGQVTSLTRPDGGVVGFAYDARGALTSITDANGHVTRYEHTATGLISKVTDAKGQSTLYGYDAGGRPTSVTYPDGTSYQMSYDATGLLSSFTDPMGKAHSYSYDLSGQLVGEKDLNGNQWSYAYDGDGRMTAVTNPLGGSAQYAYDPIGNLVSQTNPNGGVTRFVYDAISQLVQGTDPTGGVVKFTYDGVGNLLTRRDANGNLTSYAYNASNEMVSVTDAAGSVRSFVYDLAGRLVSATGPLGDVTRYAYDAVGRLTKRTDPVGAETSYTYDPSGNRLTETDPLGRVTTMAYDELNRRASVTDPFGTQALVYDSLNRVVSVTDTAGRTTAFAYRADGLLASLTAPDGAITRYEYDANGNRTAAVDPAGGRTTLEYDALGRLTRITDPDGSHVSYAYDANGNRTAITDANSQVTRYVYDLMNRLISWTDPSGGVSSLAYDAAGNRTLATDPTGKVTTFVFDALNRLTRTVDSAGGATVMTYDANGRLLATTDPTGAVTSRTYDLADRLLTFTGPVGGVASYVYDLVGNLLAKTDALGRRTGMTYDAQGRVTATTDALGRTTRYAYDAAGNRVSVTDALGQVTRFEYDVAGRLTAAIDPLQNRTQYAYDSRGNRTSTTDPEGHVTRYEYDQESRLAALVDAVGARTTFAYDANGRRISETGPDGAVARFEYDASGRLSAMIDALGHRVTREYDASGRMTRSVDARSNATRYAYDDLGRLSQVTDAEGGVWTYSYDAAGRLSQLLDANGHAQTFVYDAAGRLTSQVDALGNTTRFEYDVLGNRTKQIKPNGDELRYEYDPGNRLVSIRDRSGSGLASMSWDALDRLAALNSPDLDASYTYDGAGRLTQLSYPTLGRTLALAYDRDGLRKSLTVAGDQTSYAYDAVHRLTTLNSRVGAVEGEYSFRRDPAGRPVERRYPNGVVASLTYDIGGRLLDLAYRRPGGALLERFKYQYDANGNRVSARDNLGVRSYTYDKLNRLTGVQEPAGLAQTYVYDSVGNRTRLTSVRKNRTLPLPVGQAAQTTEVIEYTYDIADRLLQAGSTSYVFDAVGRLASVRFPSHVTSFEYDPYDRPRKISGLRSRLTGEPLPDSLYAYAPQMPDLRFTPAPVGVRTRKTDSRGVAQYVMDDTGNIAAELDGTGVPTRRYTNGLDMDQPLAVHDAQGETHFLLTDALGSVAMVVDRNADPVQSYRYDAFGRPSAVSEDGPKFTAKPFDPDAQLQLNGARYMDPDVGRWITRDPLMLTPSYYREEALMAPQALNPCAYAESNPTTKRDPAGLSVNGNNTGTLEEAAAVVRKRTGGNRVSCQAGSFNNLADDFGADKLRGRFVWTRRGGWVDMRHFFEAAAIAQGSETFAFGIGVWKEDSQSKNREDVTEFKSAYSVEDLPSNSFGIRFGAKFWPLFTFQSLEKAFVDFVNTELGGELPGPMNIGDFNRVRNFGDRPVLDLANPAIMRHTNGLRYLPRGDANTDERILRALVEGMSFYKLTPDLMAVP